MTKIILLYVFFSALLMGKNSVIEHKGIVTEISSQSVLVELTVMSACSACHAKAMCSFDSAQKTIEINNPTGIWEKGETVKVVMRESMGKKAVFLGYLLPFIVLIVSLIIFNLAGINEGISGLLSIGMLVHYYLGLYILKDRIKRVFNFNIEKI